MTGFELLVNHRTINQIKHLARQIEAKDGKKTANPQPAATKILPRKTT